MLTGFERSSRSFICIACSTGPGAQQLPFIRLRRSQFLKLMQNLYVRSFIADEMRVLAYAWAGWRRQVVHKCGSGVGWWGMCCNLNMKCPS